MTDKPIIHASLQDARNVSSTKEIKLDVRIPAEMATRFLEVFGWPTPVKPVSVAIVPLVAGADGSAQEPVSEPAFERKPEEPPKHREDFTKLRRTAQAALRCSDMNFWIFLQENPRLPIGFRSVDSAEMAAQAVRILCDVETRAEFDRFPNTAGKRWDALEAEFYTKSHGMR